MTHQHFKDQVKAFYRQIHTLIPHHPTEAKQIKSHRVILASFLRDNPIPDFREARNFLGSRCPLTGASELRSLLFLLKSAGKKNTRERQKCLLRVFFEIIHCNQFVFSFWNKKNIHSIIDTYKLVKFSFDDDFRSRYGYWDRLKIEMRGYELMTAIRRKQILGQCDIVRIHRMMHFCDNIVNRMPRDGILSRLNPTEPHYEKYHKIILHQSWLIERLQHLLEEERHRPPEKGGSEYEKAQQDFQCHNKK